MPGKHDDIWDTVLGYKNKNVKTKVILFIIIMCGILIIFKNNINTQNYWNTKVLFLKLKIHAYW